MVNAVAISTGFGATGTWRFGKFSLRRLLRLTTFVTWAIILLSLLANEDSCSIKVNCREDIGMCKY